MNRQLGAFSGMAMILIILNHAIGLGTSYRLRLGFPPLPEWVMDSLTVIQWLGAFAVPTFLFISGCFLSYAAQGDPPRITIKFLLTSLRYILFPYFIWSLVFYVLIFVHWQEQFTPVEYLNHLAVGYPYHFIPLLVLFYLLSPLLVFIGRRYPIWLLLGVALYQGAILTILYPGILGFTLPGWLSFLAVPVLKHTLAEWALFFPMGLVYGLHARQFLPLLRKYAWLLALLTIALFVLATLTGFERISFPIARNLCMVTFVLLIPAVRREQFPQVRFFERVGKKSYGLYLTNLITIDLMFFILQILLPGILQQSLLLLLLLLATGLFAPLAIMEVISRGGTRRIYRYLFG